MQARELKTLQGKVLSLPKRLQDAFASEQQVMAEWSSFLLNFLPLLSAFKLFPSWLFAAASTSKKAFICL